MKSVKLFFFLPFFLFFSLPPAFSADLVALNTTSTIVQKSSLPQWAQFEAPQNYEINFDFEIENTDGDGNKHFYTFPPYQVLEIKNPIVFSTQNRFPWNPFQSYYSRLTNSPPSSDLA